MNVTFTEDALSEYISWQTEDKKPFFVLMS